MPQDHPFHVEDLLTGARCGTRSCASNQRHHALIVGEHLGTVPPRVTQRMAAHGISVMSILEYEGFAGVQAVTPPPAHTVGSLNTHDMPTFAGFWRGSDIGAPPGGRWREVCNTDSRLYGGSGWGNLGGVESAPVPSHGWPNALTLPPLSLLILKPDKR